MAYVVLSVSARDSDAAARELFRLKAHDVFVKAMHERIATEVITVDHDAEYAAYTLSGSDPSLWPEWVGEGVDADFKVPIYNAIAFGMQALDKEQECMAVTAFASARMVATTLSDGRVKRATGLVGARLTVDT